MFVDWEKAIPKPPKELLDKCHTVTLGGSKPHLKRRWASTYCQSFVYMDTGTDWINPSYIFYFMEEADKIMFALKYV
jgi:hypothetical protein